MLPAIYAFSALVAATVLKFRGTEPRLSPDSRMYINMASRRAVPAPYCWRIGMPMLSAVVAKFTPLDTGNSVRVVATIGTIASVFATMHFALAIGATWTLAICAGLAYVLNRSGFMYIVTMPYLTDGWAAAFSLSACAFVVSGQPLIALVLVVLAALVKESYVGFTTVFVLFYDPWLLWVAVPGILVHLLVRWRVPRIPPPAEYPELTKPLKYIWTRKRYDVWFKFRQNLDLLGPLPWVALWYMPKSEFLWPVSAVVVLAWLQCHMGTDHDRLLAQSVPWVCAVLAVTMPASVWPIFIVAAAWWPFYQSR